MSVFIELTTDAFEAEFEKQATAAQHSRRAGLSKARRPVRGLEIKEDTFAQIRVIKADGSEIPLLDSGSMGGKAKGYTNFILQAVTEARMEKHQIVETFGEDYIFFFGEQPRFLDCQAVLINSNDFNWVGEFWANYEQYLRGTKCAEIGARIYLFYDDVIVDGYMVMAQAARNAQQPMEVPLQFRVFLTGYQNISLIGDPNYPTREGYDPAAAVVSGSGSPPGNLTNSGLIQGTKLFGQIRDNTDEYVGSSELWSEDQEPEDLDPTGISGDHDKSLQEAVTEEAAKEGADTDSHTTHEALGIPAQDPEPPKPAPKSPTKKASSSTMTPSTPIGERDTYNERKKPSGMGSFGMTNVPDKPGTTVIGDAL